MLLAAVAMLLPSLAMADTASAGEVVTTAPAPPTDTTTPAADQPAAPAPSDTPVTEAPAGPPTTEAPAPPPSTTDPTTPPEAEATPAPAPAPVATDPAAGTPSALPGSPDAPKAVVEPDKVPLAALVADHGPAVLPAPTTKISVDASVPDAPVAAKPTAIAPRHRTPPPAHVSTSSAALHQDIFTLDPSRTRAVAAVPSTIERVKGMPLAGRIAEPTLFAETAVAAVGGIRSGSSLLSVLAGYVLPGVGGPPATTIVLFMLVGLIVGLARAPRPQLSERLHLGGLVGARPGHGLAVCRPG